MSNTREKFTTPLEIDIDLMEDQISTMIFRIEIEITAHENRLRQLRATRLSLQAICRHRFEPSGATHGGQFEKCQICNFEQRQ